MSNLKTVLGIYEAFSRGDLPTILSHFSDDIEWEYANTSTAPWLLTQRGKEGAQAGLIATFSSLDTQSFVPKAFIEGEGVVVVLYDTTFTVKTTGKRVVEEDAAHIWRFGADGKIIRFRHRCDTLQHQRAATAD
jgi:uncharacterized protein